MYICRTLPHICEMKDALKQNMARYISLSDSEFGQFYELLTFKTLRKKEELLSLGEVCRGAFYLYEGCIRYYNLVEGEEITGQFFFENSWYSDYESFLMEIPSQQVIQALEPCSVAILSKDALLSLYQRIPKFERFGRLMAENAFVGLRKRTESLTNLSAEERYRQLVRNRPKVTTRIPQHYIASYLGIKPQSLSRIRKRMADLS